MTEASPASESRLSAIEDLVEQYREHVDSFHSAGYNETQLRREFVDPLFKSLGWDIDNARGYAAAYKDVIHEDAIIVDGVSKAPDYCFRIGGTRKFFVEAKRPSVGIGSDPAAAFQLRRYGWSAKLPLSILTNFEELAVYDCRIKPTKTDDPSVARVLLLSFADYAAPAGPLASLFSRDAVLKGSFDKYAESSKAKRGTSEVDDAFLEEIEHWREILAQHIALRNHSLTQRDLNFAVQLTLDRILFLRICEDRGIEEYGTLRQLAKREGVYARLFERFRRADERYNSGLFHFSKEKERSTLVDDLTPCLVLDDKPLKEILTNLYYPDSPYEFSVLPADILGHVYERVLGKVIRLTKGHQAKVEEKPEVRKAGGVYYTPTYIVEYLVRRSVGKLVEGKTPQQIGALTASWQPSTAKGVRPLVVLDPACGSGSFLLGAYQFLLEWYRDQYVQDGPENHAIGKRPRLYQHAKSRASQLRGAGEWHLTTAERKRILVSHIYGVDIDPQAVEVTKLSLLLKVLEGENQQSLAAQLQLFHERALPDLDNNVKCGNSLVSPDFWEGQQLQIFDDEQRYRINAFDWEGEFPAILRGGGFDAVVGNPPYLSYSGRQSIPLSDEERRYFESRYSSGGWPTAHSLFIERAVRDLAARIVAYIVPDQVGHLEGYQTVRDVVAKHSSVVEVRYWGEKVFAGVITPALTFVADTKHAGDGSTIATDGALGSLNSGAGAKWTSQHKNLLLEKVRCVGRSLDGMVADPGVHTGNCSARLIAPLAQITETLVPVLEGKQITRYFCAPPTKSLDLGYKTSDGEYFTVRPVEKYSCATFVIRQTASHPIVGPRAHATYFRNSLLALYSPPAPLDVRFFVGLLNSRLIRHVYCATVQESQQRAFPQVKVRALRELPIYWPDLTTLSDRKTHDHLTTLVQKMLDLQERLAVPHASHERTVLQRETEALDREIDHVVYGLYGLTPTEVAGLDQAATHDVPLTTA